MEDPWANAWGEPSKSSLPVIASGSTSSWSAPSVSVIQGDHEDDLSAPEWSIKPTSGWGDPDIAETSLWGSDASAGWNPAPSTFDRISLASKDSASEISATFVEPASQIPEQSAVSSSSPSSSIDEDEPPLSSVSPPRTPPPAFVSTPDSPKVPPLSLPSVDDADGFGTFETAVEAEGWSTPSKPGFSLPSADALAWGTEPWEAPNSAAQTSTVRDEDEDEWEAARQQKEKQDRHVPPELLAGILHQFAELSPDIWQEPSASEENPESPERTIDIESLGLNSIKQRLVPEDLVLPVNVPFSKTFVSKQTSEALKLTRHSQVTRSSPIALYMASKGSTSWENSLKSRPNIIQEDIVPAGWKILDTTKEDPVVADDGKKKPNGGLLSFFGRRGTNSSTDTAKRSSSPIASISSVKSGSSPRTSVEGGRRSASQSVAGDKSTPSSPSVASFGTSVVQKNDTGSLSETQATPTTAPINEIVREPSPPPPSAVSRFLGRFSSRPKTSSMDSIALSQDDLEFLSDVPSLTSPEVDHDMGFDALSSMIKSPPLPTTLPAPLAPPPKAPPKPTISSPAPGRQSQNDDFMSFFDDLDRQPQAPIQSESPLSLLAAVPTPPVKSVASSHSHSPSPPPAVASLSIPTIRVGSLDQQPDQSWSSFDYPSAPMNKPLPPPSKRAFVPIMSSSSRPSSTAPPLLPKPGSITPLSPPPTGRRGSGNVDLLSGTSAEIAPLPPHPTSRSHTPLRSAQPTPPVSQPVSIDDDDDFADFLSSPAAQTTQPGLLSFNDFTPAPSQTLPPPLNGNSVVSTTVSEFDDFLGSLPPQPPAKSNSFASNSASSSSSISSAKIPGTLPTTGLTRKISRKADHSRTLSLMETAAARGRWLNPPSPLPEALQPPPNARVGANVDLFNSSGSSMQTQQANIMASLATSHSTPAISSNTSTETAWNFPAPMKAVPMPPTLRPQASFSSATQPPPTLQPSPMQNGNASAAPNGSKAGGLSAQDLSFFEGL